MFDYNDNDNVRKENNKDADNFDENENGKGNSIGKLIDSNDNINIISKDNVPNAFILHLNFLYYLRNTHSKIISSQPTLLLNNQSPYLFIYSP